MNKENDAEISKSELFAYMMMDKIYKEIGSHNADGDYIKVHIGTAFCIIDVLKMLEMFITRMDIAERKKCLLEFEVLRAITLNEVRKNKDERDGGHEEKA